MGEVPSWIPDRKTASGLSRPRIVESKRTSWPGAREVASGPTAAMRPMALLPIVRGVGKA